MKEFFRAIRRRIADLYWQMVWSVLPTVWVQPNMRAAFVEYIRLTRLMQKMEQENDPGLEAIQDQMDPLWYGLNDEEQAILDSGRLPYASVEGAAEALPRRGGTIRCAPGPQYLLRPVVLSNKRIRLIGGTFQSAVGTLQMSVGGRFWIVGCTFMEWTPGPRDWSPRGDIVVRDARQGDIIVGDGRQAVIRMNVEVDDPNG